MLMASMNRLLRIKTFVPTVGFVWNVVHMCIRNVQVIKTK